MASRKRPLRAAAVPRFSDTVNLARHGVNTVLGDLEARLMPILWAAATPLTAREVHARLPDADVLSPLTSVTVLNRLVEKGLLARATSDGRYRYSARIDEATFVARTSRRVMERVLTLGEDAVAASFVDVLAERDPALLRELARLVQQKLDTSDTSDT